MSKMSTDNHYQKWFPPEPESVHQTVLHTLEALDENTARKLSVRKWAAMAAALAALMGITATAAGQFPWSRQLREHFGNPSQEVQDELGENGLFSQQGNSVTNGGITVTVLQTVQDKRSLTALLQVTAEDRELEDKLEAGEFDYVWLRREDGDSIMSHPAVEGEGSRYDYRQVVRTEHGITVYMIHEFYWTLTEDVNFDHFLLRLKDFQYANGAENRVSGYWDLPITVDTAPTAELTRICDREQEVSMAGDSFLITEVMLTPLSIEIKGQTDKSSDTHIFINGISSEEDHYALEDLEGNIIDTSGRFEGGGSLGIAGEPYQTFHVIVKFDGILDVRNIGALLLRNGEEEIRIELQ